MRILFQDHLNLEEESILAFRMVIQEEVTEAGTKKDSD